MPIQTMNIIVTTLHPTTIIMKNEPPPIINPINANNFRANLAEYFSDKKSDNFAKTIQPAALPIFGIDAKNPAFCKSRFNL